MTGRARTRILGILSEVPRQREPTTSVGRLLQPAEVDSVAGADSPYCRHHQNDEYGQTCHEDSTLYS